MFNETNAEAYYWKAKYFEQHQELVKANRALARYSAARRRWKDLLAISGVQQSQILRRVHG